jgi:N-methylhydantoinase A
VNKAVRVGIDVGGTFTDVAVHDPTTGETFGFKLPSIPTDRSRVVLAALEQIGGQGQVIGAIVHGSTIATNAVLERKGAVCALVTTRGFRDVLEIGRQYRGNVYDLNDFGRSRPLVERDLRLEITERVGASGAVLVALDMDEVPALIDMCRTQQVQAVAISLLHSYRYPEHERALKVAFEKHVPYVTISTDVNAEFREYERTSTVVLNAYTMPAVDDYLTRLGEGLERLGLARRFHVVASNGGMRSTRAAAQQPVSMLMSGPAAGIAASRFMLGRLGLDNAVTLDMGGTSTDVCLIHRGRAAVTSERKIGGYPVRIPSLDVETIGAGGGSLGWIDAAGALKVGPQSAGADPGPACYGQGGAEATVTDANVVLGYLGTEGVWGGSIRVQHALATQAIDRLAGRLGLSRTEMAEGILDVANSNMIGALRLVSVQRGYDLRDFALVAYGGAGPVHAGRLAAMLQIPRVIVPALSGQFSALGGLVSDVRYDAVRTVLTRFDEVDAERIEALYRELEATCTVQLLEDDHAEVQVRLSRSMDLRYIGQKYELEVPVTREVGLDRAQLTHHFDDIHRRTFSYATGEPLECVNLRVAASVAARHPTLSQRRASGKALRRGERRAFFRQAGEVALPIYDREALPVDWTGTGPLAIEDAWSTTLVYPGQHVAADHYGNLVIELRRS